MSQSVTLDAGMCLPQCVVVPPIPHRDISIWKPPPFTSNWNVSKSTCVTCTRLKCGYEPVKPLSRSTGTTEVFKAMSMSSRGDSIACLTMRLSDAGLRRHPMELIDPNHRHPALRNGGRSAGTHAKPRLIPYPSARICKRPKAAATASTTKKWCLFVHVLQRGIMARNISTTSTATERDAHKTQVLRIRTESLGTERSLPTVGPRGNAAIHQKTDPINADVRARVTTGSMYSS
jgi:hypothetical protein